MVLNIIYNSGIFFNKSADLFIKDFKFYNRYAFFRFLFVFYGLKNAAAGAIISSVKIICLPPGRGLRLIRVVRS